MGITIAGIRPGKAKGLVIHNDAGGNYATAKSYKYLLTSDYNRLAGGFAHFYIDERERVEIAPLDHQAWHTATPNGNAWFVGVEVCQSAGDEAQFLRNEQAVFKWCAEWFKINNLTPNRDTVRLHREFSATACPHRSWDLHGRDVNKVKDYFISQVLKYMGGNVTQNQTIQTTSDNKSGIYPPKHQKFGFDYPRHSSGNWRSAWHPARVDAGMAFYPKDKRYYSNANRYDNNDLGKPCNFFTFKNGAWIITWQGQTCMTDGEDVVVIDVDGTGAVNPNNGFWAKY